MSGQPVAVDIRSGVVLLGALVLLAIGALVIHAMGHPWICPCGTVKLFSAAAGPDNSQHLFDWYTPSHLVHGLLFFFGAWLIFRRWSVRARFLPALFIEVAWEVVEATPFLQERYRGTTVSLDYFGDSVVNSIADVLAMVAGYWLAARLPVPASIALAIALEVVAGLVIRDNLTLNVLMLVWPLEAIKTWQAGG